MTQRAGASSLPIKRIAVTIPPADWFHGITRALFDIYRQAFAELGLEIVDVPLDAFVFPDVSRIAPLLEDLGNFQPEMACGLSHGLHGLNCRLPAGRDGWREQLFTEVLDIPTICIWDHAPFDVADQLFRPFPLEADIGGAGEMLRRTFGHPNVIHWSRDSGQTRIMRDLGFLRANRLIQEPAPCLPGFCPQEGPVLPGAGFVGHFYQEPEPYAHPALADLAARATAEWLPGDHEPLWDVLVHQLAGMDPGLRDELALHPDQKYFWHFAHRLILHQAQNAKRLRLLGAAGVPVACYGDLIAGAPGVPANLSPVPGHIEFGPPLAAALARHEITIDVMNPGFVDGYSHKPVLVLASGGFLLMDRKQDFIDAFGEAGEAASYHGPEDLGAKVEQFLSNPRYRREVGDAIREQIALRFQLKDVLRRVIHAAWACTENSARRPKRRPDSRVAVTVMDLLPGMSLAGPSERGSLEFTGRGALVVTAPRAWEYAVRINFPAVVSTMREPHLRVVLLVETGRIGISRASLEWAPLAEQYVSATSHAITVTIELPRQGVAAVILRNTIDAVSRALVIEASLCDRPA